MPLQIMSIVREKKSHKRLTFKKLNAHSSQSSFHSFDLSTYHSGIVDLPDYQIYIPTIS